MRTRCLVMALTAALWGQPRGEGRIERRTIPPGSSASVSVQLPQELEIAGVVIVAVTNRDVEVTVIRPDGSEVSAATAEGAGVGWMVQDRPFPELPAAFSVEGKHILIILSALPPKATYVVKADGRRTTSPSELLVLVPDLKEVEPEVHAVHGAKVDRDTYHVGDRVVVSLPPASEEPPVKDAQVFAEISRYAGASIWAWLLYDDAEVAANQQSRRAVASPV